MVPSKYRYYIQKNEDEKVEVTLHFKELSKKVAKENGQEFFRSSLDGKISIIDKDYGLIQSSSLEDVFTFIIEKYNSDNGKWEEYYKGYFSKIDCKFDHARKKCELNITTLDSYNKVLAGYENTYDLIKLAPAITKINIHKRPLMQAYTRGYNSISNFFGGTYWEDTVDSIIDSHDDLVNKYHFYYQTATTEFTTEGLSLPEITENNLFVGANGSFSNNICTVYLEKVASKGAKWEGEYANGTIYNNQTGAREEAYVEFPEIGKVFKYDTYAMLMKSNSGAIIAKSSDIFYVVDPNNIYLEGFDLGISMVAGSEHGRLTNIFTHHIYRRLLCDVDSFMEGDEQKTTYDIPYDDFVSNNRNYRKCIGLRGGQFFYSSKTVDTPTKYGMNDYGKYFTDKILPPSSGVGRLLPLCKSTWINTSFWYAYNLGYEYFEEKFNKKYVLKDSFNIAEVIKALLKEIDPDIKHEATTEYSKFLYDDSNPLGLNKFYTFITQKSNVLKGEYDRPAQKAEVSLKDIMDMLKNCFKCYWYIENNMFKIEHILFFMNGKSYNTNFKFQLDFTTLRDSFNNKLTSYFQLETEYDKSDLIKRYEFSWMDDSTEFFAGLSMDIKSSYAKDGKTEDVNINQFSSDIDFMLFNPEGFSEDGFALLCPIKIGSEYELPIITTDILMSESGYAFKATIQNFYASWFYLMNLYLYDLSGNLVQMNPTYSSIISKGVKKFLSNSISFLSDSDLDEMALIKTQLGNGSIDNYSVNINTRLVKAKLLYKPS